MHFGFIRHRVAAHDDPAEAFRPVGWWLLILAAMVLVMVCLGGLTRLTGSGLSMVEWQPFTLLPPLSQDAWADVFAKYQASPQYRLVNAGMTLTGFKEIFWLEYIHRLWGRLIGLAFLLPLVQFVAQGRVGRVLLPRLILLFLLGGAQGALGWFMVASGLADRPEVSHYRLAAHLLAALLIYGALLWSALDHLDRPPASVGAARQANLDRAVSLLLALVVMTMAAGALVAGLHAGLIYNSFPRMGDTWLPSESFDLSPGWINMFENHALVQFDHRLLAAGVWMGAVGLWLWGLGKGMGPVLGWRLAVVPVVATLQAALGIATLLSLVPVGLAALHQAGAFLLFSTVLWALHGIRLTDAGRAATYTKLQ
ncbi:COX15/CtaA family protein [Telmatospirillum sp.]|uniref:COX15/CtaA family protein n=1 Tax=Telmatospirillum sp. TaxID=2079197 RepID=UPI00283C34BF|nr:COX15/CtaA family protein [Telmatospirillum sp.]MDR3440200.1 COX15/CtaA family protein [Telmatospirillum sp.]